MLIMPAASAWRSLYKKGGRPFNQPVGRHDAYGVGDGYIESVKCSLDKRRLQ